MEPKTNVTALMSIHTMRATVLVENHEGLELDQAKRLKAGATIMVKDRTARSLLQAGLVVTVPVEPETETELENGN